MKTLFELINLFNLLSKFIFEISKEIENDFWDIVNFYFEKEFLKYGQTE